MKETKGKKGKRTDGPPEKFDQALKKLEEVVEKLEAGDLPLEESILLFEKGVQLSKICGRKLEEAEEKIEMLVREQDGTLKAVPFPAGEEGGNPERDPK